MVHSFCIAESKAVALGGIPRQFCITPLRQDLIRTEQPAYLNELQNVQECLWCSFERPVEPVHDVYHHVQCRLETIIGGIQGRDIRTVRVLINRMIHKYKETCKLEIFLGHIECWSEVYRM